MGKYDFTPQGMRNAGGRLLPRDYKSEPDEIRIIHEYPEGSNSNKNNVNIKEEVTKALNDILKDKNIAITTEPAKRNKAEEFKELLRSTKGMSLEEKRFIIKAQYGLLTESDIDSIL